MRRRLMAAILALVAGTLLLAGGGEPGPPAPGVRRPRRAAALQRGHRPRPTTPTPRSSSSTSRPSSRRALRRAASGSGCLPTGSSPTPPCGARDSTSAPARSRPAARSPVRRPARSTCSSRSTSPPRSGRSAPRPIPDEDTAVLVATRGASAPVGGLGYFALLGLVCLLVAGAVAFWLANRFSRPLVPAAAATERIAGRRLALDPCPVPTTCRSSRRWRARSTRWAHALARAPRPTAPVPAVGLPRAAHATHLHPRVRRRHCRRDGRRRGRSRGRDRRRGTATGTARGRPARARTVRGRRFSLHPLSVDVADVATAVVGACAPTSRRPGWTPRSRAAARWRADPDRLHQLLAQPRGERTEVRTPSHLGHGPQRARIAGHRLRGSDDGPGISPEDLPRVFEPHFSSDRIGGPSLGHGIGTGHRAELSAAMGGGVTAHSPLGPEGGGTTVDVWLPSGVAAV